MATITAAQAGNWDDTNTWTGGAVPGNGDTADLNGFAVTMNIATIPASGTLLAITAAGNIGTLVIGGTAGANVINATTLTAGTVGSAGTFQYSGTTCDSLTINGSNLNGNASGGTNPYGLVKSSTKPLTLNININAGAAANAHAVYLNAATGNVTIVGTILGGGSSGKGLFIQSFTGTCAITSTSVKGGSGNNGNGVYINDACTFTITSGSTCLIEGGTGARAYGVENLLGSSITLTNCNMKNGTGGVAWGGKPPTWVLSPGANSVQWESQVFYPRTGSAYGSATLAKETGANARGGSGTCAKLTATSTTLYGYWEFYVPATASTPFTFSLYYKAFHTTTAWNGTLDVSIYDTDDSTLKNTNESVSITDDGAYHQFSATSVTPTATGLCRVVVRVKNGSDSGGVYIDDIATA